MIFWLYIGLVTSTISFLSLKDGMNKDNYNYYDCDKIIDNILKGIVSPLYVPMAIMVYLPYNLGKQYKKIHNQHKIKVMKKQQNHEREIAENMYEVDKILES